MIFAGRTWNGASATGGKSAGSDSWRELTVVIPVLNSWQLIASLALCMGIGTPSHAQAIQPVPPTPVDIKKVELGGTPWNPQRDQINRSTNGIKQR
jgi:hypothetical protein